ncbi:MAG: polymer-forming cytoskeletal protein, partial [Deltaproteobacteria bacterium]|nr:polymer-forming cytoskeletal protein [Deltaproteobacteria bacterium]
IFVGNTGIVEADLEAKNIVIQGEVTGNIKAHKQLEIHPSGRLIGDCSATSIDIKEGAMFEGRSVMMKTVRAASGRPSPPAGTPAQPSQKQRQPE